MIQGFNHDYKIFPYSFVVITKNNVKNVNVKSIKYLSNRTVGISITYVIRLNYKSNCLCCFFLNMGEWSQEECSKTNLKNCLFCDHDIMQMTVRSGGRETPKMESVALKKK